MGGGVDRVIGRIPVLEALKARKRQPHRLYYLESAKDLGPILNAAEDVPTQACTRPELDRLSRGENNQGVVLEAAPLPVTRLETWVKETLPGDAVVVLLDGVEDPHNFGAIVRTASAFGAIAAVFGKDRAAPLSPSAAKSAAGAMERLELVQATNLARGLGLMQKAGFWTVGLDGGAERILWDADLRGRVVLVIGSEGKGMRRIVRDRCDFLLRIPIGGPITSLNASAAAAVALAECARQRAVG